MKTATELLQTYLDSIRTPAAAAGLFADDGVLELPWVKAHAQGPTAIEKLIGGLLVKLPEFSFQNLKVWIDTPDKAFAEYQVDTPVAGTGKRYRQTYAGLLIARDGKIQLLREALDTVAAKEAFAAD